MAFIDCVQWSPQGNQTVYAYKFPQDNLSTRTQLIVNESQVALLFSKGQLMGKFGPGKHTLDTENLPILRSLYGFPFGGKNPFMAQVWFVNLIETFSIPWSVGQLPIHDPDYQTMLNLFVSGQYGLKIVEPEKFLIRLVGTRDIFTQDDMTQQFAGEFSTKVKSAVVQFMLQNKLGYKQISAFLDPLSQALRQQMAGFWEEMGLTMPKFYVSAVDIDTSTPEGRRQKEAIATQSSMQITGHSWQQEQMLNTVNNTIDQMTGVAAGMGGGTGGLLGGLMAMNMMGNMGAGGGVVSALGQTMSQMPGQVGGSVGNIGAAAAVGAMGGGARMVYCSACARKFPSNMEYCPNCGNKYRPCPNCGTDNPENARRCVSCGTPLAGGPKKCAHCHTVIPQGCQFCPSCGTPVMVEDNLCSRCGTVLAPGVKFCPRCGNKRGS